MGRNVEAQQELVRLGSYEIVRKLARGGMAELFLARTVGPEGFAKLVVLKKILPNYAENPKFVRLFLDEAKLVAQMQHPHIAQVYDMGKAGADYFFTMEYVHGQDVRAMWRRAAHKQKPVPVEHAIQIARNIAAALHYAHERTRDDGTLLDIVHRDVSPSNILISYEGAVKLVDFGVAKAATSSVKTRTGALKGKISYMSPEQAKGAPIDRRSDIFSLGIVLWELLTGRRLYKAENDLATIQMIINSKPQPPSQIRQSPPALDAIIARMLHADVAQRYQTAEAVLLDLDRLARENQLDQAPTALRGYMHHLFDEELRVWHDAHAQGQTLTEHIIQSQSHPSLLPSESDASDGDADVDDEPPDDDSVADSLAGSDVMTSAPSTAPGGLPPTAPRNAIIEDPKTLTNENEEMTQFPTRRLEFVPAPTIQLSVPPPPERPRTDPSMMPHAGYAATPVPGQIPHMPTPVPGQLRMPADPAAFPLAPTEWRRATEPSAGSSPGQEALTKHVLIGCSVLIAIITLLAIAFGGGGARNTAASAPGPKVQMQSTPARP